MRGERFDRRDYYWVNPDGTFGTITPRVLLREPNGYVPMIPHTGDLGLPGGHTQMRDIRRGWRKLFWNPLAHVPTVIRETKEETGVDIRPFLRKRLELLGIVNVTIIDAVKKRVINAITPVLYTEIPGGLPFNDTVVKVVPGHIPKRTFPDASLALFRLHTLESVGLMKFAIEPVILNENEPVVFRMGKRQGYVAGAPPFWREGYQQRAPYIPRTLPPHLRKWLKQQYARMY